MSPARSCTVENISVLSCLGIRTIPAYCVAGDSVYGLTGQGLEGLVDMDVDARGYVAPDWVNLAG